VVTGVVTEGWAPGARSSEESQLEWNRRLKLTRKIQKSQRVNHQTLPIEWVSRTYIEPSWADSEAKRRWRERKVFFYIFFFLFFFVFFFFSKRWC
jgi:hypothetical protein